ncbi:restriction endonuclease subunit R [Floridanema evergladense]|uniref:Restriction endonuclease subunit R n=1 Tax=Floridaenema evergladense BLCC-F167 TaxID=3153639 RepID=A0ABV4WMT9_9CYAN
MVAIREASQLSLNDVHRLLKLEEQLGGSFTDFFSLEVLTEFEQQEIAKISSDFRRYINAKKLAEGLIKFVTLSPLMRLAGFFDLPIKLTMEDSIAIEVEDEDTKITGRLDILAVNRPQAEVTATPFWVLLVEAKNSAVDVYEGLPQLLTYAFKSLQNQAFVWGLVSNGRRYLFVNIRQGTPPIYQIMPELNIVEPESASKLLQVLKAISKQEYFQLQSA